MKKWLSLLLCLTMVFSFMQFSFAEELAMLTVEEAAVEYGPVEIIAPEEEPEFEMIEIEEIETSAEAMGTQQEAIATADASAAREIIGHLSAKFADCSGEEMLPEGLESFDNLNSSYTVTVDSSYKIDVPNGFTKSSNSTSTNFIYTYSSMAVSVGTSSLVSLSSNRSWLINNGYSADYDTYNGISVVYGVSYQSGSYYWSLFFNTSSHTVMMQTGYPSSFSRGVSLTAEFFTSVRYASTTPLTVGTPSYSLSADKKSIFINRPAVSGGTGNYTYAYNIYDSNSNPVNYFYSSAASVAATPGYNGKFCVFVVVSDGQTSKTVNTGWMDITGNAALTVTAGSWSISADKRSVFINRPTISGGSGHYTIAYNIYDSNSNPVNYFYSNEAAVAASPGYNGTFNVYVVVSDGSTSKTVMTGWFNLTGYPVAPKYRALLIGQKSFSPVCKRNEGDVNLMASLLATVNGGQYQVTKKIDLTRTGVKNAINSTFAGATANDVSLILYASHGVTAAGSNYGALSTYDGGLIKTSEFASWLNAIPGKVIVLCGTCGSGALIGKGENGEDLTFDPDAFDASLIQAFAELDSTITLQSNSGEMATSKFLVMTAAMGGENSWGAEGSTVSSSYNWFVKWLYDAAIGSSMAADTNGNRQLTMNEWYTYVKTKAASKSFYDSNTRTYVYQHPQVYPTNSSYVVFTK